MDKIRIGILGASEIAFRRFLPALKKESNFVYAGVAYYRNEDIEKAKSMQSQFGGTVVLGFDKMINDNSIDAIYVPQPPALHYKYGKQVLESGKHLFMEKPFTTDIEDTTELIEIAKKHNLAATENYMFRFHNQIASFLELANSSIIGVVDHFEVRFSFPLRAKTDFRYLKEMGGGALLDCGGYTIMLSNILVGGDGCILPNKPLFEKEKGFEVDMGGSGLMYSKSTGIKCYFSFGMDSDYSCYVKAFGSKGSLLAPRVLTAPSDYDVNIEEYDKDFKNRIALHHIGADDSFIKSLDNFYNCINVLSEREENFSLILKQAGYIEQMQKNGGIKYGRKNNED